MMIKQQPLQRRGYSIELGKRRPLRKLAEGSVLQGETEHRTGVYTSVHEDSSTVSTKQDAPSVEFPKRSRGYFKACVIPLALYPQRDQG